MKALLLALFVACTPGLALDEHGVCGDDVDAAIDAPPPNYSTAWVPHGIVNHVDCKGGDGVDVVFFGGKWQGLTACEEGAKVIHWTWDPVTATASWVALPGSFAGPEDAIWGHDAAGNWMAYTSETGAQRLRAYTLVAGVWSAPTTITTGQRYIRAQEVSPGVIITGGYGSPTPSIQRHTFSGTWSTVTLGQVGWTKNLQVVGSDYLVWDSVGISGFPLLKGLRFVLSGVNLTNTANTMGGQYGINWVSGDATSASQHIVVNGTAIPYPSNFGWYREGVFEDFDGDGTPDLAMTASHADDDKLGDGPPDVSTSSVLVLLGPSYTTRWEVSGPMGYKHDNLKALDFGGSSKPDIVTTEEHGAIVIGSVGYDVVWYENPL